ncbi:MAG: hypothetical protein AUG49_06885 [Catenulispora sp. 13_1_20CM_3_70_7]|nr:MAG: hypothetical protein AUG49_06885 [Catenulispora sp. 13_1_20CM_3_70_7]
MTPLLAAPLFSPAGPGSGHQLFGAGNGVPAETGGGENGAGNGHRPSVTLVPQQVSASPASPAAPAPTQPPHPPLPPLPPPSSVATPPGDGNAAALAAEAELRASQRRLTQETRIVETLYMIGQSLARELDTRKIAKLATDAATTAIDAEFGTCFYSLVSTDGQAQTRFVLAGKIPAERFESLPMPRPTQLVGAVFPSTAPIRCADVTTDPR